MNDLRFFALIAILAFTTGAVFRDGRVFADWPAFLGPDGAAHSRDTVPTKWSDAKNLIWKVDLPGSGSSSPVTVGDRVVVTRYASDAKSKLFVGKVK